MTVSILFTPDIKAFHQMIVSICIHFKIMGLPRGPQVTTYPKKRAKYVWTIS